MMPKQSIYPLPNPDGTNADRRVEIGWARYCDVQIATTMLKAGAERDSDSWDGQYVTLNRPQINELIRALRVARDQAYGRDE